MAPSKRWWAHQEFLEEVRSRGIYVDPLDGFYWSTSRFDRDLLPDETLALAELYPREFALLCASLEDS